MKRKEISLSLMVLNIRMRGEKWDGFASFYDIGFERKDRIGPSPEYSDSIWNFR